MAFMEMKIYSDALGHGVGVNVVIPQHGETMIGMNSEANDEPTYKTLWLLHGLSDDHTIWSRHTSIERYASEIGFAVVMPCVDRSWYADTAYGAKYFTFITEELPAILRKMFRGMSAKREDNFIGGLSMGGYGAMKAAFTCPERYFGCIGLSGAYDIVDMATNLVNDEAKFIFGYNDPSELNGSCNDVFHLVKCAVEAGKELPRTYMWCGDSDFIRSSSEKLHKLFCDLGVEHIYDVTAGNHCWCYWDTFVQCGINYVLGR
ncbi:MAG: esterase family protein [Clostridia bacterium]|nr:esterase family protein [Clostridia bacterium]